MKQNGIVRRIDNLGRVVIPKEIRKTLHIHDGELVEMLVNDEKIIIQKYSSVMGLESIFSIFIDVFSRCLDSNILITDLDKVIFCDKNIHNLYCGKLISSSIKSIISEKRTFLSTDKNNFQIVEGNDDFISIYVFPLIYLYDPIGSIIVFSYDDKINNSDVDIVKAFGEFVNRYIDN